MKLLYTLFACAILNPAFSQGPHRNDVVIPNSEYQLLESNNVKGVTYKLVVTLPAEYNPANEKRYPVVYYNDAFLYTELITGTNSILSMAKAMPAVILLGISYEVGDFKSWIANRTRDLTPSYVTPDSASNLVGRDSGKAKQFVAFTKEELIPFIDRNYKTAVEQRTLLGHSLGGLFATWVLLYEPDMFQNYLLGSPSLWWDDYKILGEFDSSIEKLKKAKAKVFIGSGLEEPKSISKSHKAIYDFLNKPEFSGLELESRYFEGENHISVNPVLYTRALRFFFKKSVE
ncbi:MAG: alpha/beta hydrolase-fold protein [Cyclobacteriaceae bacterium]